MGQELLLGRAALSVPMRQSMPGRGAVREGHKGAAQDVWPVCMCLWFSGAVLRICTRVLHHCVLLWFGGLLQSRGASPLRPWSDLPHPIRSLHLLALVSLRSGLSLRLRVPPGTTAPGTWQRVVMLNLRPSTSVPVSTLQRLTESAADIRSNDAPAGEDDPTDSVRHVPSDDHQLPASCTTTPPATYTIKAARPAIGPSPWPSQLDT